MKLIAWKYRSSDPIWIIAETKSGAWSSRLRHCLGLQWKTGFIGWIKTDPGDFVVEPATPVEERKG